MGIQLESELFQREVLDAEGPVLVIFFAAWCPKCSMMLPIVKEVEDAYRGRMKVVRLETEDFEDLTKECGIEIVPTFLIFHHGEALGMMTGILSKNLLMKRLDEILSSETD